MTTRITEPAQIPRSQEARFRPMRLTIPRARLNGLEQLAARTEAVMHDQYLEVHN